MEQKSKNRLLLQKTAVWVLALAILCAASWIGGQEAGKNQAQKIESNLNERILLYKKFLSREFDQIALFGRILSDNPQIISSLQPHTVTDTIAATNKILKEANTQLRTSTIFLMDKNGLTIAASNFDQDNSFVGKNYSFRPYFQDAIQNGKGQFLAVGITSNQLGYYIAHAIYYAEELLGVIVLKADMGIFDQFTQNVQGEYFLSDRNGVIFLSSNKTFELKSLAPITATERVDITRTRQYPINRIEVLNNKPSQVYFGDHQAYSINYQDYFVKSVELENLGWKIWLLSPATALNNHALLSGFSIVAIGFLILLAIYLLYRHRKDTKRFQIIVDNLPSGVTFFNNDLQMLICNDKVKKLLAFPDSLFKNRLPDIKTLLQFNAERGEYGPGDPTQTIEDLMERMKARIDHVFERRRPDGTILEVRGVWLEQGLITTYTDITDRKKAEEEATRNSGYLQALLQNLDQGVTVTDENLNIVFWNNAFFDLLNLPDHLKKPIMRYEDLIRYNAERGEYGPGNPEQHVQARVQASLRFEPHKFERTRPDGHTLQVTGKPLHIDGEPFGFISTYVDITEHKRMASRLRQLANTDPLTQVGNRRHFTTLLEREIKRCQRTGSPLSILLMDLDHFKAVNDRYGHGAGDITLKKFAETCSDLLRNIDVIGRLGGEEFCIFLPDTDRDGAFILGERVRSAIENLKIECDDNQIIRITVSIGIATFDNVMGDRIEDMLQRADKALYRAKHEGRNRIC